VERCIPKCMRPLNHGRLLDAGHVHTLFRCEKKRKVQGKTKVQGFKTVVCLW
jgi:hypothetical protein